MRVKQHSVNKLTEATILTATVLTSIFRQRYPTLIVALLVVLLSGCGPAHIDAYRSNNPKLDLYEYFTGKTKGWGVVLDRSGSLKRQFEVDIIGSVDSAGRLVLEEDFLWNDGEQSRRVWTITKTSDRGYTGEASDVVGEATGVTSGNVLNWNYQLNLEVDNKKWKIRFDDWMFLQTDDVLLNRAEMSKFGFRVGEVIIAFQKLHETMEK